MQGGKAAGAEGKRPSVKLVLLPSHPILTGEVPGRPLQRLGSQLWEFRSGELSKSQQASLGTGKAQFSSVELSDPEAKGGGP